MPSDRPDGIWRPWTLWLPCALAFTWSGLLIVADDVAGLMGSWDTSQRGLGWLRAAAIGHWALAAVSILVLAGGLSWPSRRRAAAITAWIIIPAGLCWIVIARLIGSS